MLLKILPERQPPSLKINLSDVKNISWLKEQTEINHRYDPMGYRNPQPLKYFVKKIKRFGMVLGCSHTFGYGVFQEDRYSDVLSRIVGIPIYNAGVNGVANNFLVENSLEMIKNGVNPEFVVIQYTSPYRYTFYAGDEVLKVHPEDKKSKSFYKMLTPYWQDWYFHNFKHCYEMCNYLWASKGVKVINVQGSRSSNLHSRGLDLIKFNTLDYAADNTHNGPQSHLQLAQEIAKHVQV